MAKKIIYKLKRNGVILGNIKLIKIIDLIDTKYNRAMLTIYIKKQWRRRWLLKTFSCQIFNDMRKLCVDNNIDVVITHPNHKHSARILEFFNFVEYNNIYFKLVK